jgi:TP901 family phage tail tape measure protein
MPGTYQYDVEIKSNVAKLLSDMKQVQDRLDTVEGKEYKIKLNVDEKKLSSVISNLEKMLDSLSKGTGDFKQFENLSKELSNIVSEVQSLSKAFGKVDDSGAKTLLSSIQNIDKSLSELSQNILNVNKNMSNMGGNTGGAVKQVENISNAYQDAAKEAEKLADAQSKIGQKTNISSASTESVTNSIKEENNVLEQNTQKVKENTQAKEQNANANLNKYDKRLDSYNGKVDKYQATIDRFNDGGWTSDTYLKNVQAVRDAVKQYATLLDNIKTNQNGIASDEDIQNLDKYEKKIKETIATVTNMSASEKGYSQLAGQKEIDKINKILRENSAMSSEAKVKIKAYKQELISGNPSVSLEKIHGEIMKIVNAEELAGRAGRSMFDVIKEKAFYGFAAQIGMYFGFNDIVNGFKQVASTVIDLNTQITDLAKVSEATSSQIYGDFSSYADIAKDIGGTISDTISATADWSRNGYNLPDSKELARVALLYKNVGDGIDIDTANESLISTLRGFKMEADEAEKIIDIFNNVSNNEPIDSGGIGEALQRSAASFNAANTSLQESVALISTTNSVIQNPEKVGNMWKVVSMRIRSATSELEQAGEDTDGLVTSTADLQKMIKAMTGYDILESDGKTFKSIYDIVLNISKVWNNLSDLDQSSLLQALAGKQQSNALAAALSNPELLEKSYQEAMDSAGSAAEEEKKHQQSVQYTIDQTKAKLEELSADLLSSDFLKGAIDAGGKLIEVLDGIVKSGNAIPTLLAAIGASLSFKNIGKCYVSA